MNILTFDIEDWFHLLEYDSDDWSTYPCRIKHPLERILSSLENRNIKASFFCLGWIAEKYPHLVKESISRGHEIASHGYGHKLVYEIQGK